MSNTYENSSAYAKEAAIKVMMAKYENSGKARNMTEEQLRLLVTKGWKSDIYTQMD